MAYLGASKNKKYQENLGFYKPNFLGISYIVKGLQLECGKTTFCYSPYILVRIKELYQFKSICQHFFNPSIIGGKTRATPHTKKKQIPSSQNKK